MSKYLINQAVDPIKKITFTMRLALCLSFVLLGLKIWAFSLTGSASLLSDVFESTIHILATAFATFSVWLSTKPADRNHPYGHDRINFFSVGLEGTLILLASVFIGVEAVEKWRGLAPLDNINVGLYCVLLTLVSSGWLGWTLINRGRQYQSLILIAHGRHVWTDCLTSVGVLIALVCSKGPSLRFLDPLIALLIAGNICGTGLKLIWKAICGLMDSVDQKIDEQLKKDLSELCAAEGAEYHCLRHRNAGAKLWIEFHLLLPDETPLLLAHDIATRIENGLKKRLNATVEILTHIEPKEAHDLVH